MKQNGNLTVITPIQKVADYWNKQPCNIHHSPKEFGSKAYFDEVEQRKYFVEPHIPSFAEFSRRKGKKVLEIGCGIGTDTINFARAGAKVTAVDLSEKSLEIARHRAKIFGFENKITFHKANAEELTKYLPLEKYDLIYSFGVIHHSPHPEKIIQQLSQYCHKDTVVKIMVYYRLSWKVFWILIKYGKGAFWKLNKIIADHSEAQFGSPVTYTYTKKNAHALLKGFKITNIFVDHIFPYSIPEYLRHEYKKVWYFRYLPQPIFRFLERRLGWHLCITARPIYSGQNT